MECKYISPKGCTVKCLPCKLFVCDKIMYEYDNNGRERKCRKYKTFTDKLERLRKIAIKHDISFRAYFRTKDEVLDISRKRRGH